MNNQPRLFSLILSNVFLMYSNKYIAEALLSRIPAAKYTWISKQETAEAHVIKLAMVMPVLIDLAIHEGYKFNVGI